jgi:hypothetical protein
MNLIRDIALRNALRPRVAHSLPGRVRLHIPALRRIPADWTQAQSLLTRLFRVPDGVRSVELELRTGSALIEYDGGVTSEADVLAYLGGVMSLIRKHWDDFAKVPEDQVNALADRLEQWLEHVAGQHAFLHHKQTIPSDVWP